MAERVDAVVIGAGVVGLAVARAFARNGREVLVLEATEAIGTETSSRNSEVIHAGIYYPTDSNKANWCVAGKHQLYDFCAAYSVPHRRCGKLIVATQPEHLEVLRDYQQRALRNGVGELSWLTDGQMAEREPAVRCLAAVESPSTGIIDSHAFMVALQGDLEAHGGVVAFHSPFQSARPTSGGIELQCAGETLQAGCLVNCAGLHAVDVARRIAGLDATRLPTASYARGHYYAYSGASPFSQLVYPIAEAGGLGVHVTLDLGGQARFGPDVQWLEGVDYSFDESRRDDFVAAIRRYFPDVDETRLHPSYTGVRPKITGPGEPAADFRMDTAKDHGMVGLINLFGIESPGLTASLAIAGACWAAVNE